MLRHTLQLPKIVNLPASIYRTGFCRLPASTAGIRCRAASSFLAPAQLHCPSTLKICRTQIRMGTHTAGGETTVAGTDNSEAVLASTDAAGGETESGTSPENPAPFPDELHNALSLFDQHLELFIINTWDVVEMPQPDGACVHAEERWWVAWAAAREALSGSSPNLKTGLLRSSLKCVSLSVSLSIAHTSMALRGRMRRSTGGFE